MLFKGCQTTWTTAFLACTTFACWTITIFTAMFRGRGVALSFSILHTFTTRYSASWIIRPISKYTIYRAWLYRTFMCFSPFTNTICTAICRSWIVTFSCAILNSTTASLGTFRIIRPFPKFSINRCWYKKWKVKASTTFYFTKIFPRPYLPFTKVVYIYFLTKYVKKDYF